MVETPFKLTREEVLQSAATTALLLQLERSGTVAQTVGECCETPQYGFTASASWQPVGPRFVRITDIKAGVIDWEQVPYCTCADPGSYMLGAGDILVARSGSVGKSFFVGSVPEPSVFASYMIRLRPKPATLPDYVYWCLQSQQFWAQTMGSRRGSAMKNINGKMLAALHFPWPDRPLQEAVVAFLNTFRRRLSGENVVLPVLPHPLADQRRVIARIEELSAKIEEARKLRARSIAALNSVAASTKKALFSDEARESTTSLGEVSDIQAGVTLGRVLHGETVRLPYLRVANVQDGYLDVSTIKHIDIYPDEMERWLLQPGDLLLTEGGDWDKLGRGTVWQAEVPNCIHQNHIFRVRLNQKLHDPWYVSALISSPYGKEYFQGASKQTTNLASINQKQLKAFPIPVVTVQEQRRIVAYLDNLQAKVNDLKTLQEETATELDALMPSILSKAFSGSL